MKNKKKIERVKFYGNAMKLSNQQRARAVGMLVLVFIGRIKVVCRVNSARPTQ